MANVETLKGEINNLQLKNKGKNLKVEELDKVIKEVYSSTKEIWSKSGVILNDKKHKYIRSRLGMFGVFCYKILGNSNDYSVCDPDLKSSLLGGVTKSDTLKLISKENIDNLKKSYHFEINKFKEKYKIYMPSLILDTMDSFVNNVCESYKKNLGNVVSTSNENDTVIKI